MIRLRTVVFLACFLLTPLLPSVFAEDAQSYLTRGLTALKARQYERARDELTVALELNPRDPVVYYQLSLAEFNLGNVNQARLRLRQAHALLQFNREEVALDRIAKVQVTGEYPLIPVEQDGWRLRPKSQPTGMYDLRVGSTYKMQLQRQRSSRSKALTFMPIGLLLAWVLAR